MIKVVKFGGSSLASAEQFAKVGKIIHADKERRYVVPSAPGKRNSKDTKVTDMLYACYDLVEKDEDFRVMLMKIKDRYDTIINGLNLKLSLEEEFKKISENFKNKAGALHDPGSLIFRCIRITDIDRYTSFAHREYRILMQYAGSHVGELAEFTVSDRLDRLWIVDDPWICDQKS